MGDISKALRYCFQPDGLDRIYQQVAKFSLHYCTGQTMERYLFESDVLRRKAEARVIMRGAFPDAFVSISRTQHAAVSRNGKSLLLSSVQGSLDFPIAANEKGRVFGPCGGAARQDVLAATDPNMGSEEEDSPM